MGENDHPPKQAIFLKLLLADEEYFHDIYETYFHKIYNYIYTRTWDHAETERLAAKTFLKAIDGTEISLDDSTLDCWVYRILKHVLEEDGIDTD